jgi:hypothetical protein
MDSLYDHAVRIHRLENFLAKRKDNVTQTLYVDQVLSSLKCTRLKSHFWNRIAVVFEAEMTKATKTLHFLQQVLQAGYPKLLRIFLDLFAKISLISGEEEKNTYY